MCENKTFLSSFYIFLSVRFPFESNTIRFKKLLVRGLSRVQFEKDFRIIRVLGLKQKKKNKQTIIIKCRISECHYFSKRHDLVHESVNLLYLLGESFRHQRHKDNRCKNGSDKILCRVRLFFGLNPNYTRAAKRPASIIEII